MSLAEDLQRSSPPASARAVLNRPLQKSLSDLQARLAQEPEPAIRHEATPTQASFDLLDRASKGMAFIVNRYKHLEDHIKQLDAWSNDQIHAAEMTAARWRDAATAAEAKLDEVQRTLDSLTRRAETAEQAMQRDKESLKLLQERIVAAFGLGSEAHDALATTMDGE